MLAEPINLVSILSDTASTSAISETNFNKIDEYKKGSIFNLKICAKF
jgi:hypothetical protein